jgi:hypothetical protein
MQPTEERRKNYADDHDLLIALHEQVKGLRDDIRDLKDNNKTRTDDHETRLRFIEKYLWAALGILAIIEFIGFSYILNLINQPH